ncbi:hypothetical protein FI667_g803, partial [Globisporangium splendens]
MGQVCSGAGMSKHVNAPRDPTDPELEAIEMRETKIADFDAFFEQAAGPLNEMVEIHNAIAQSEENLKAAAAAIQGEAQVRLTVRGSGAVTLDLWKFDDEENEYVFTQAEIEEKLAADPALRDAFERTEHAITELNSAVDQPTNIGKATQFIVKRGRLFIEAKGSQDAFVRDVNVSVFSLRKQLALAAHVGALSEAVVIFVKEIAKVEELGPLSAETDDDGKIKIMCGDQELDLRKMDKLSKPAAQLRDALVELVENVKTAVTSLPELSEKSAAFCEEAQTFPGKVPDAVSNSGLGVTEIPKASLATGANAKSLTQGPKVAKATSSMIVYAGRELKQAMSIPLGG